MVKAADKTLLVDDAQGCLPITPLLPGAGQRPVRERLVTPPYVLSLGQCYLQMPFKCAISTVSAV